MRPLPDGLKRAVARAGASYLAFQAGINAATFEQLALEPDQKLRTVLGYGGNF